MDDDHDEDEGYEDAGFENSDEDEDTTLPCPACGETIYDDAERCPACGLYFSREHDRSQFKKPTWIIATVLLCLLIVLLWAASRGF